MGKPVRLLLSVAALASVALAGCSERADVNPVAPGSPGTGNEARVVEPVVPQPPPGGSTGPRGTIAPFEASGGRDMPEGTTGAGSAGVVTQPGVGLAGGLNDDAAVIGEYPRPGAGPTSAPSVDGFRGSSNATSGSKVGER